MEVNKQNEHVPAEVVNHDAVRNVDNMREKVFIQVGNNQKGGDGMGENIEENQLSQDDEGRVDQLITVGEMQMLSVGNSDRAGGGEICGLNKKDSLLSGGFFYENHHYVTRVGVNEITDDETRIVRRTDLPDKRYWSDDGCLLRRSRFRGYLRDVDDDQVSESDYLEVGSLDLSDRQRPRGNSFNF
ncbi:unnamed protein product [Ilex paraguariensis]|uniref:Uncharacterized protein n=1 Tax=Ilex paraguariensis TaxID=185542 RepID=A0ABC8V1D1_9AQUA